MNEDERAIREVVERWMAASQVGDVEAVLDLMTEDVVFSVPGQDPFGKAEFAEAMKGLKDVRMEGRSEILELELLGNGWAFIRNYIDMTVTMPGIEEPVQRTGNTLTLLRKEGDGRWRLTRDANMVS